jgi:hypothetical protein
LTLREATYWWPDASKGFAGAPARALHLADDHPRLGAGHRGRRGHNPVVPPAVRVVLAVLQRRLRSQSDVSDKGTDVRRTRWKAMTIASAAASGAWTGPIRSAS